MGDDGLADVCLPDAHGEDPIFWDATCVDQTVADGEGPHSGGKVSAVATPVDKGLVDRYLAKQVVDVVIRTRAG